MARQHKPEGIVRTGSSRLGAPFREMEEWFDEMFRHPFSPFRMNLPRLRFSGLEEAGASVDMYDDGENLVLKAELPGMGRDDVEVNLTDETIIIAGADGLHEQLRLAVAG